MLLVALPVALTAFSGLPTPAWPSRSRLEQWLHQPLTPEAVTGVTIAAAWCIWVLILVTALRALLHP